jgi:prepilin-type N-terminal cleavage/methylation domain-containing protein
MKRRAFTLIELLVVVAIIALLISLLLPNLKRARDQARDVKCRTNMGQVMKGFLFYAAEWRDNLPGSTWDEFVSNGRKVSLDWLGVGTSGNWARAPQEGTIFRYINNDRVYRCPNHLLFHETSGRYQRGIEWQTSYTAPVILTGAPLALLKQVRYPEDPPNGDQIPKKEDSIKAMMPLVIAEEDSIYYLVQSRDSAWSNVDEFTTRHFRKTGGGGYIDGHAEHRAYAKDPRPLTSWHLLYELIDGRMVSAGHWGENIRMGYLRNVKTDR